MLDYLIRGGQVVTPGGVGQWDIGVRGEKIVAIAEAGGLAEEAGRVIDAGGKIVVPGGVEPHAHVAAPIMGHPEAETAPPPGRQPGGDFRRYHDGSGFRHPVPRPRYLRRHRGTKRPLAGAGIL